MIKKLNKIEKLIDELCPEGVEFKELGEVCNKVSSGGTPLTSKADYYGGDIPWLRTQEVDWVDIYDTKIKITKEAVDSSSAKWIASNCIIVAMYGATAAKVAINKIPLTTNQACCNLEIDENQANYRFVFHWLTKEYESLKALGEGTQSNLNAKKVTKYQIPIPPLAIQKEIVRILDNFTELEAELEARKKQYEYYRDELLTFDEEVERKPLEQVAKFLRGTAITAKETTAGDVPVVANASKPNYFHGESNRSGEIIVIARSGAYCGLVSFWNQPIFLTDAFSIHLEAGLLRVKFIYYFLKKNQKTIPSMKKGYGVPHVRVKDFESYSVPVPSLAEQERIVGILDKFDALVNDISTGLPAELEARRKQYEYYRNQLLTFKPLEKQNAN